MIESLRIYRFRGIMECSIENLRRLNVFLGYNNCGKSSVLDALFLFCGASNPKLNLTVNTLRNYSGQGKDAMQLNFYRLDTKEPILLEGCCGGRERKLEISYQEKNAEVVDLTDKERSKDSGELKKTYSLNMRLSQDGETGKVQADTSITINGNDLTKAIVKVDENYKEELRVHYLTPSSSYEKIWEAFSAILKNKQEEFVIQALRKIEPAIKDMVMVDGHIMVDVGLIQRIPIEVLGDGIKKVLSIIISIYQSRNGIILIDEIDNGLHYKSMPAMWQAILYAAQRFEVQVFVTTHNIDSLRSLNNVLTEASFSHLQETISVYTLRKDKADILHAMESNFRQFNHLIEQEIEMR